MNLPFLLAHPVVAILRGLVPERALEIGWALFDAGVRVMEVPLNSPDALSSIRVLSAQFAGSALVGAGTVLDGGQVAAVAQAGGRLIVSPNTDALVIAESRASGLISLPGVFTPTEAFQALRAGADGLKLFPADSGGPGGLRALRAVLPADVPVFAVGGVLVSNLGQWRAAGADGVGVGSALFRPEMSAAQVHDTALRFVREWERLTLESANR